MADFRRTMIDALHHRPIDHVPWSIKFTVEALERYRAHCGAAFDPIADTGCHVVTAHTNHGWQALGNDQWRDHYGVVWDKSRDRTLGVVVDHHLAAGNFSGYTFPDPDACPVYAGAVANARAWPDRFRMVSIGFALFERAWSLVGMEQLMVLMHEDPAFVHELLDRINAWNLAVIRRSATLGIDAIHIGDDWGSQHGPLFGPRQWRTFIAPRLKAICDACHQNNLLLSLHCCGNVEPLMEDIVAAGVDVFDPFQPEAMDIRKLRQRFRGRLAFWGGLSVQRTLPHGTPAEVEAETRALIAELGPGGGYILAPAHSISGDVPPENIDAFLRVANAQILAEARPSA
ncbi:MAG: uroporphyrinogen decarboxylase family protein [Planctomycetota bacterium]